MTCTDPVGQPVCPPSSSGGPVSDPRRGADLTWSVEGGEIGRHPCTAHAEDGDFGQAAGHAPAVDVRERESAGQA